jgi:eukaryotic-like serine/threonine-protein kinase
MKDVTDLAAEVLDGRPVDWAAAESTADTKARRLLKHLRSLETLAEVHRTDVAAPSPPGDARLGFWGHLRLIARIGTGTFGEVYRAWDSRLDREVALKLLPADPALEGQHASLIHEGRLLARVRHQNVATIYGAEQIGDRIGLWMELVAGRTLEQMLENGTTLSPSEAARIGVDLCAAVGAVHDAGLLHRDIKAHNVMVAADGRVVLMDFGTGRDVEDTSRSDLAGTPLYVAPEVLCSAPATVQSDVYSLGVLLYHVVTGTYPVRGTTLAEVRRAHETNTRVPLREARSGLPLRLIAAIERAIDPRPEKRHRDARSFAGDLRAVNQHPGKRWLAFAAAAAIVIAASAAWFTRTPAAPRGVPVIAVLPFENRGGAAEGDVFADGLTDEIQRNLHEIEGLTVRASGSWFKNQLRDVAAIFSELRADFILEGAASWSGGVVQVQTRLARVAGDETLWTHTFDGKPGDIFAIQDEISRAIANKLMLSLGRSQRRHLPAPDVYYLFLKARGLQARRRANNAASAAGLFEQVVASDPAYAAAWAGLASALAEIARDKEEVIEKPDPRIERAALRAIQLDPSLAEANAAMGGLYARGRDWARAREFFVKSLELNSNLTTIHTDYVLSTLMPMGRVTEAMALLDAALKADPASLDVRRVRVLLLVDAERYEEAIQDCRWVLERDPAFPFIKLWLARALLLSGKPEEALPILEKLTPTPWPYLGYLYAVTGRREEAEALAAMHPDTPRGQMMIYGGLGDKERAFEALERTAVSNWWRAATWSRRPELALLRGDRRLAEFKTRYNLPE